MPEQLTGWISRSAGAYLHGWHCPLAQLSNSEKDCSRSAGQHGQAGQCSSSCHASLHDIKNTHACIAYSSTTMSSDRIRLPRSHKFYELYELCSD